jgi:hypothetical protein
MPKQRALDLRGEGLFSLWRRLPEPCRQEAIAIWARMIARAAQSKKQTKTEGNDE